MPTGDSFHSVAQDRGFEAESECRSLLKADTPELRHNVTNFQTNLNSILCINFLSSIFFFLDLHFMLILGSRPLHFKQIVSRIQ
jgi:hypothetical protein